MAKYSDPEKLACIEREIAMRKRVYPRWIEQGRMDFKEAEREIAMMKEIAEEYRARIPTLFPEGEVLRGDWLETRDETGKVTKVVHRHDLPHTRGDEE